MAMITWLHFSDWHQEGSQFGHDRKVVRDGLLDDLRNRAAIEEAMLLQQLGSALQAHYRFAWGERIDLGADQPHETLRRDSLADCFLGRGEFSFSHRIYPSTANARPRRRTG